MGRLKPESFDLAAVSTPLLAVFPMLFVLLLGLGLMLGYYNLRWWADPTTEYKQLSGQIETADLREGGGGRGNRVPNVRFTVLGEAFYAPSGCAAKLLNARTPLRGHLADFKVSANGYHFYADGHEPYLVSEMAIDGALICTLAEGVEDAQESRRLMLVIVVLVLAGAALAFFKWRQLSRRAKQALHTHYPNLE